MTPWGVRDRPTVYAIEPEKQPETVGRTIRTWALALGAGITAGGALFAGIVWLATVGTQKTAAFVGHQLGSAAFVLPLVALLVGAGLAVFLICRLGLRKSIRFSLGMSALTVAALCVIVIATLIEILAQVGASMSRAVR